MNIGTSKSSDVPATGLIAGLTGIAGNGFGLLLSRLELAAVEMSQALRHLLKLVLVSALAIVAAWFAIACSTAFIIYLTWETMGWTILLIMALIFAAAAGGLLTYARSMLRHSSLSFSTTRAELHADRDILL